MWSWIFPMGCTEVSQEHAGCSKAPACRGKSTQAEATHLHAQADINQSADELEEMLRASRAKMEAKAHDLADWEVETARLRNEGTFFKGLFKADVAQGAPGERQGGGEPSSSSRVQVRWLRQPSAADSTSRAASVLGHKAAVQAALSCQEADTAIR